MWGALMRGSVCVRASPERASMASHEDAMVRGENEELGAPARDLEGMGELHATQ
jgi:hypothetical protein